MGPNDFRGLARTRDRSEEIFFMAGQAARGQTL
jgi:hypothetical protein